MVRFRLYALIAVLIISFSNEGLSQKSDDSWRFKVAPYLHFASLNGTSTVGFLPSQDLSFDFSDILSKFQGGFMARAEIGKGRWGGILDVFWVRIGDNLSTPRDGVVSLEVNNLVFEALPYYRFNYSKGYIDVYAGIRYWNVDIESTLTSGGPGMVSAPIETGSEWIDPVLGGRIQYGFSENWFSALRLDVGGFGAGSDFSWNTTLLAGYKFSPLFSLTLAYKYLYVDYNNGERGTEKFTYDVGMNGLGLGFIFDF